MYGGDLQSRRQSEQMIAEVEEYRIGSHDDSADMCFRKCGERLLKIGILARCYDPNLSAKGSCGGLDVPQFHIGEIDIRIIQVTDGRTSWDNLIHKLQTLGFEVRAENGHPGDVATWFIEAGNIAKLYGIAAERNDDRNCFRRGHGGSVGATCPDQYCWLKAYKVGGDWPSTNPLSFKPCLNAGTICA